MFLKRRELSKKEKKRLYLAVTNEFTNLFPDDILKDLVELIGGDMTCYMDSNGQLVLIKKDGRLFPTLRFLQENPGDHQFVTVDNGAIPYVLNGAKIFAPGIVEHSSFKKNEIVLVKNLKGTVLAVGIAMLDSEDLEANRKGAGAIVLSLHYLHDEIWNFKG
ncbi:MAG: DUF1947 domain-containing protein [Candidatus Heimdallarchaeota archaeon]